jgi:hypothetical protein
MADKKNIVIKVKYPASGRSVASAPAPQIVTEWNIKRILLVAGALVLLLGSGFYFINGGIQSPDSQNLAQSEALDNVQRAVLTYEIKNKEPVGEITRTVKLRQAKPIMVYYYTELNKKNGRKVYHEWLKNGAAVSRQELNMSDDTWRVSSRKLMGDNAKGKWAARLVDENGQILNEKTFKVDLIK